jgi:WD40 repeat protein
LDMVSLWQVSNGSQVYRTDASFSGAPQVAFSPDGSLLAVSAYDNLIIKLLRAADGTEVRQLKGSWTNATDLAFSPGGSLLVAADGGSHTSFWNVSSGSQLFYLEDPAPTVQYVMIGTLAFSPDGLLLATGGGDTVVRLWDASSGALLRTLEGNKQMIFHVSFSPDGKILAVEAVEMLMYGIP